jgi:hypothetical protein
MTIQTQILTLNLIAKYLKILILSDAQMLVHAVKSNKLDIAPNGVLFREIKALACLNFSSFSIFLLKGYVIKL